MINRLRIPPRAVPVLLVVALSPAFCGLQAQQSAFNFSYPGPNTIAVGPTCSAQLSGNIGTPAVTSTVGGTITVSEFDPILSGYDFTDEWTPGGPIVVWWQVADNLGNSASFNFSITFADQTAPVFDLTGVGNPLIVNSIAQVPPAPDLPVADNCTDEADLVETFNQTTPPALCQGGTFTRTWTATDEAGNQAVFTQNIIVYKDTLPPQITVVPQNGAAPCQQIPAAYNSWLATQMAAFQATDATGPVIYTNNAPVPFPPGCIQPLTVTFRATDQCGLMSTQNATFSSADSQDPVLLQDAQDLIAACSPPDGNHLSALSNWIQNRAGIIAVDSCPGTLIYKMRVNGQPKDSAQVVAEFLASFANGCGFQLIGNQTYAKVRGYVRVDWFVDDACGNSTFAGQGMFGAVDTVPPQIVGPALTVEICGEADDSLTLRDWIDNRGYAQLDDDCSTPSWADTFSWTTSTGQNGSGAFGAGPYPASPPANECNWWIDVSFGASDDCGNAGQRTLRFQIQDTVPPIIASFVPVDTIFCPGILPAVLAATITDNCDSSVTVSRGVAYSDSLCSASHTALLTWTATDDCGNSTVVTQTFVVRDTTRPVFTLVPAGFTAACHSFTLPPLPVAGVDVIAADTCGTIDTVMIAETSTQNPNPAICGHYTYTVTRLFTAVDDCGNTATATQIISVVDNQPPVFAGFTDTILVCEVQPLTPPPTASDWCSGVVGLPALDDEIITGGNCDDSYTKTLVWRAEDGCGNIGYFNQNLHVQDTVKPTLSGVPADVFVGCDNIPAPPNNLVANDNCDESVAVNFVETEIRDPNPANCAHWTNYMILREWTATDNCGNARTYTQNISVQDNAGPVIVPQDTVTRPNEPGLCGATVSLPTPLALYDVCTSTDSTITLRDTVVLVNTTSPGDLNNTPVDPVVFSWPSPNLPPNSPVVGNATLTIFLDNVDAEGGAEFFTIYGEDDYPLGQTNPTAGQCGSGTTTLSIPANLLNNWLTDGTLTVKLTPFGTGATAVNLVCAGGRARANLAYARAQQQIPPTVTFSLNGAPPQPYPPATGFFLPVGEHTVTYFATDCAGNTSSASTTLEIEDHDPPSVTPPAPITAYVSPADCQATVMLPFPALSDNCGFSGDMSRASDVVLLQFVIDPNADTVANTTTLIVPDLLPNAVTGGVLKILHKGDNAQAGEFFEILDEQNNPLIPATNYGSAAGQCVVFNETTLNVSAPQINAWAADLTASFTLVANTDAATYSNFIGPCGPLNGAGLDGISAVQATLTYNYAIVEYEIRNSGNQVIATGELTGSLTSVTLPPGVYSVQYRVFDGAGTPNVATFALTVRDTIAPTAACMPTTIFTHPSGAVNYTLQPGEINNGSFDNCPGAPGLSVSPSTFTCNSAGSILPVTLTVTDAEGNTATCTTQVSVNTVSLSPAATAGCEGAAIQFFANPPPPANIVYSYLWKRPGGATLSMAANPSIPSATLSDEGTYTLTITGPTGCTATGIVTVDVGNLPTTPNINLSSASICEGQNVTLSTAVYGGATVFYSWYTIGQSGDSLLTTTSLPTYQVSQPTVGVHHYMVKVLSDGCTSYLSVPASVTVNARPVASVVNAFISICEGQPLQLGTAVTGVGYNWTGPGFGVPNTQQYPLVTLSAAAVHEGTYTLVVTQNGCASAPVNVVVDVLSKPATPVLSGATAVCEGDTVKLTAVPTQGFQFQWISPSADTIFTSINELILPDVMPGDSGAWRVRIVLNGCVSDASLPQIIQVQSYPQVSAAQAAPLCQGLPLPLAAVSDNPNVTYSWTGPDGFTAGNTPNPVDPTPASGNYCVTVTTSFGCSSASCVAAAIITPPNVVVTNTAPLCADGTANAQLQSVVFSPNPPLNYSWTGPDGFASSDPNPILPGVSEADNGTYILIVTDAFGCTSGLGNTSSTVVGVEDAPAVPILSQPNPVCEGGAIILTIMNPSNDPSVLYTWTTANGNNTVTVQPSLTILNASMQNNGVYTVFASTPTCASAPSPDVIVTVNEIPDAPVISAVNPNPCAGDTLQLIGPQGFDGYIWTGQNLTASVSSPVFVGADSLMHGGLWYLRVILNGCVSPQSEPLEITVRKRPKQPIALPAAAVCLDQPDALILQIVGTSAEPGAQFTWYNGLTQTPLGPPSFAHTITVTDLTGFNYGPNTVYVEASEDGCTTKSTPVTVQFDQIPTNTADAGPNIDACSNQQIFLAATQPFPGMGYWSQVGGLPVEIVNPASNNSKINGGLPNVDYQFAWTLSAGACESYSSDTMTLSIAVPELAQVLAPFIDTCFATCAQLHAAQGQLTSGYWTQPATQVDPLGITIADTTDPHTTVCNLTPGSNYFFYWNIDNGACGVSQAQVIVRSIGSEAFAGIDQSICSNDSCSLLQAAAIGDLETGQWTSPNNPNLVFSNANSITTTVCGLQTGDNIFVWTTNNGFCGDRSVDSVIIHYEMTPTAFPDLIEIPFGTTVPLNILDNDLTPALFRLEVVSGPMHGDFDQNTLTYQPDLAFAGDDEIRYRICNLSCAGEGACSNETIAILRVLEAGDCQIPTLITPNGDNYNDEFFIPCLPEYPDNEVTIFNQWGDQVYHAQPYNNDWMGLYDGEPLPAGTYYFVVRFTREKGGTKTGFLIIQR